MRQDVFLIGAAALCGTVAPAKAQSETLDLVTFTPPKGWTREALKNVVGFTQIDNEKKTWCRIMVYRSTASKGSLAADFESEWQGLAVKPYKAKAGPEKTAPQKHGDWEVQTGKGTFPFSGEEAIAQLFTASAGGRCVSVLALSTSTSYLPTIRAFLATLALRKPELTPPTGEAKPPAVDVKSPSTLVGKFTFDTTNFDDGWTARQYTDYVQANKGNADIFLHYSIPLADSLIRDLDDAGIREHFWNLLVGPRYANLAVTSRPTIDSFDFYRVKYMQGEGVDKATGKKAHIGFRVIINNGIVTCVEARAASQQAYDALFPNAVALEPLSRYNKFAVGKPDLVGEWSRSGGAYAQYYNAYTGSYAGMATVSSSYKLQFTAAGTFQSNFQGASGFVGNLAFATEKKKGSFTTSNWELSTVDQDKKKSDYNIWFEAIRGGRILHLQDKKYSGSHDALVKVK
jgi:hypothetical protein